jgi:hypothetical protein
MFSSFSLKEEPVVTQSLFQEYRETPDSFEEYVQEPTLHYAESVFSQQGFQANQMTPMMDSQSQMQQIDSLYQEHTDFCNSGGAPTLSTHSFQEQQANQLLA